METTDILQSYLCCMLLPLNISQGQSVQYYYVRGNFIPTYTSSLSVTTISCERKCTGASEVIAQTNLCTCGINMTRSSGAWIRHR